MGQKANLLTLRKKKEFNFINIRNKDFLYTNNFLCNLKKLFDQKKIFLANSALNILGNQTHFVLDLFFRTAKLNRFKRKILFFKKINQTKTIVKSNIFSKLYLKTLNRLKTNLIIINVNNLNKYYNKKIFLKLFFKFKRFHNALFPRRFNFFIDFLKITILFIYSKINLRFYTEIIGQIFKILPKRRHNFFFLFVEQFFKELIYEIKLTNNLNLKGVKFMLSGRIQAKPRAKFKYFQLGKIPMQSINSNIDFSKLHVYTIYGVFGLKIWIYRI
jgi:hypothetical protein